MAPRRNTVPARDEAATMPRNTAELRDKIIHFGGYRHGYLFLYDILRSKHSTSVIIIGKCGTGKMTLVREVVAEVNAVPIYLSSFDFSDDFAAFRHIAQKLGLKPSSSMPELMKNIEGRIGTIEGKIVVVLQDIEEFCSQRQSLLYCLTNLAQHGENICLLGLTMAMDSTEFLEKRVRSRLNAQFYNLKPPYSNKKEYVEFASELLGGIKIEPSLKDQLEFMYDTGNLSIRAVKRFLISICSEYEGKLTVNQTVGEPFNPRDDISRLADRLTWLTKKQLELLKVAVVYCSFNETDEFTLAKLYDYAHNRNYTKFEVSSQIAKKNAAILASIAFFIKSKQYDAINQYTVFSLGVIPSIFQKLIKDNKSLQDIRTDTLWKSRTLQP